MISDGDSIASSSHVVSDDEGQDSSFEESSALLESSNSSGHEEREVQQLIRKESKDVALWREIVTGMMVITGALVTIATFIVFSRFEVNDFSDGVRVLLLANMTAASIESTPYVKWLVKLIPSCLNFFIEGYGFVGEHYRVSQQ
jgi:hypothetical protein